MGEPTIYNPSIYKGNGVYKNGAAGGGGGGGGLPPEYTEVEYIQNVDKGVIRCEFDTPTDETIFSYFRFKYDWKETYSSDPESILVYLAYSNITSIFERVEVGSSSAGNMSIRLYYVESTDYSTALNISNGQNINCLFGSRGTKEFSSDDNNFTNGFYSQKAAFHLIGVHFFGFTNSNNQWVFSDDKCGHQKINRLKIFGRESGKLIYDFVPVRKDLTPGFFELITQKFFPPTKNAGAIICGQDVV